MKEFIITALTGVGFVLYGMVNVTLALSLLIFPSILAELFQQEGWHILYTIHAVIIFYVIGRVFGGKDESFFN